MFSERNGCKSPFSSSAKRLAEPDARMARREVIEPAELTVAELLVKLRRLEGERVEIGGAAALLARGRLGALHELRADPVLAPGLGDPEPIDEQPVEREHKADAGLHGAVRIATNDPVRRPVGLQADAGAMRVESGFDGANGRFVWRGLGGEGKPRF